MCIRDRDGLINPGTRERPRINALKSGLTLLVQMLLLKTACLLYTSDAADERSSVDLGGRRIIKKKNKHYSKQLLGS